MQSPPHQSLPGAPLSAGDDACSTRLKEDLATRIMADPPAALPVPA